MQSGQRRGPVCHDRLQGPAPQVLPADELRLEGEAEPLREQVLPVRLLVRESCGGVRTVSDGEGA